jgi:hypothetical protein
LPLFDGGVNVSASVSRFIDSGSADVALERLRDRTNQWLMCLRMKGRWRVFPLGESINANRGISLKVFNFARIQESSRKTKEWDEIGL